MRKLDLQRFAQGGEGGEGAQTAEGCTAEKAAENPSREHWQQVDKIYGEYLHQAEGLRELFPDFDVRREMQDQRFARMVSCGVGFEDAFLAAHGREILPAAMAYAAQYARDRYAASLAGGTRPAENGISSSGAVQLGSSVSAMSRETFSEVCRRVGQGERVSFG